MEEETIDPRSLERAINELEEISRSSNISFVEEAILGAMSRTYQMDDITSSLTNFEERLEQYVIADLTTKPLKVEESSIDTKPKEQDKMKKEDYINRIEEGFKEVVIKHYGDDRVSFDKLHKYAQSLYMTELTILYPEITIKNEVKESHTVYDLYVIVPFRINFSSSGESFRFIPTLYSSLLGTRGRFTIKEYLSGYGHSHLSGYNTYWGGFCLGGSIFRNLINEPLAIIQNDDKLEETFEEFKEKLDFVLYGLDEYLKWESITTGPYKYISRIGNTNIFSEDRPDTSLRLGYGELNTDVAIALIKHILENEELINRVVKNCLITTNKELSINSYNFGLLLTEILEETFPKMPASEIEMLKCTQYDPITTAVVRTVNGTQLPNVNKFGMVESGEDIKFKGKLIKRYVIDMPTDKNKENAEEFKILNNKIIAIASATLIKLMVLLIHP